MQALRCMWTLWFHHNALLHVPLLHKIWTEVWILWLCKIIFLSGTIVMKRQDIINPKIWKSLPGGGGWREKGERENFVGKGHQCSISWPGPHTHMLPYHYLLNSLYLFLKFSLFIPPKRSKKECWIKEINAWCRYNTNLIKILIQSLGIFRKDAWVMLVCI